MKTLELNRLFAALILASLVLSSLGLFAQKKTLQTEHDGFQWYELEQNGKVGAQSMSGTNFIPLSRGYNFIYYHNILGVKWFGVIKGRSEGACDITGREIVAPGRYDEVSYDNEEGHVFCYVKLNGKKGVCDGNGREVIAPRYDDVFSYNEDGYVFYIVELDGKRGVYTENGREVIATRYKNLFYDNYDNSNHVFKYEDASGHYVSLDNPFEKSTNTDYASGNSSNSGSSSSSSTSSKTASTTASTSSSSSTSSGGKKDEGLLYQGDYTEGTLVGQRTGWTMAPGFPQHFGIKIYEDHLEDMGTWKYEGKSMNGCRIYSMKQGFGSSAQSVKYFVDGNFNITSYREVCAFDCEVYVSQFSKGNVAFNINNSSQDDYNGGNSEKGGKGTTTQQKQHKCKLCGGTGRVVENNATSFGNTKYCDECKKTVPDSHYHKDCPSCGGDGWW